MKQAASVVNGRIGRWAAGQEAALVQDYLALSLQQQRNRTSQECPGEPDLLTPGTRRAALRAVRDGALGKAARILSQDSYPLPEDVPGALRALHPPAAHPLPAFNELPTAEDFTVDEVLACLRTFAPGSAGGPSGLMAQHLHCATPTPPFIRLLQQLARLCSDFAWGRLPPPVAAGLAAARLIPLGKKGGGVRPIAVGETIRRLAGKLLISR